MKSQRDEQERSGGNSHNSALFGSLNSLNLIQGSIPAKGGKPIKKPAVKIPNELFALEKPDSKDQILQW